MGVNSHTTTHNPARGTVSKKPDKDAIRSVRVGVGRSA